MSKRLSKLLLLIGTGVVFVISAVLADLFIVPILFKPEIVVTSSGSYSYASVEERYVQADSVARCVPVEILPAQYTSFGDSNGTMTIITTDIVMSVISSDKNSLPETFILRVEGGEIEEDNIRMVSSDSPLDYMNIGTEYLIFLSEELSSAESSARTSASRRIALGATGGVFVRNASSDGVSTAGIFDEDWVSLTGDQVINNSTNVTVGDKDVSLLSQLTE